MRLFRFTSIIHSRNAFSTIKKDLLLVHNKKKFGMFIVLEKEGMVVSLKFTANKENFVCVSTRVYFPIIANYKYVKKNM